MFSGLAATFNANYAACTHHLRVPKLSFVCAFDCIVDIARTEL